MKIRGNASHIAEKYVTLSRDAQASGDRVQAENYLQHAEHYFRLIAAAQAQQPQGNQRDDGRNDDMDDDDDMDHPISGTMAEPGAPQPSFAGEANGKRAARGGDEGEGAADKPRRRTRRPRKDLVEGAPDRTSATAPEASGETRQTDAGKAEAGNKPAADASASGEGSAAASEDKPVRRRRKPAADAAPSDEGAPVVVS